MTTEIAVGPELDAWLAEHVLGRCPHRESTKWSIEDGNDYDWGFKCDACGQDPHAPSTRLPKLSTTWEGSGILIEAMRKQGYSLDARTYPESGARARFFRTGFVGGDGIAPTFPAAVALAARAAKEAEGA